LPHQHHRKSNKPIDAVNTVSQQMSHRNQGSLKRQQIAQALNGSLPAASGGIFSLAE
jgi:hypothetical protein